MTVAAVMTMAVSLLLVAGALLMRQATNKAAVQWKGGVELSIFLNSDVTNSQRLAIGHQLAGMQEVKQIRYVDKPHAYAEFKEMFANTPDLVSSLTVNDMPPSYRVVPDPGRGCHRHRRPVQEPARRQGRRVRQGGHLQPC